MESTDSLLGRLLKCFSIFILTISIGCAKNTIDAGKCEPYFVSTGSSKVNVHVGPGKEYKLSSIITQKGLPLRVAAKYDHWRKIECHDGTIGWVHKSLLSSKKRTVITKESSTLYGAPKEDKNNIIADVEENVILQIINIRGVWVKVKHSSGKSGWILKKTVFGVLENENW